MRQIRLTEHQKSDGAFRLSTSERDAIADAKKSITVEPAPGQAEHYFLPLSIQSVAASHPARPAFFRKTRTTVKTLAISIANHGSSL